MGISLDLEDEFRGVEVCPHVGICCAGKYGIGVSESGVEELVDKYQAFED